MDIIAVWLTDVVFFLQDNVCILCKVISLFHCAESLSFYNS